MALRKENTSFSRRNIKEEMGDEIMPKIEVKEKVEDDSFEQPARNIRGHRNPAVFENYARAVKEEKDHEEHVPNINRKRFRFSDEEPIRPARRRIEEMDAGRPQQDDNREKVRIFERTPARVFRNNVVQVKYEVPDDEMISANRQKTRRNEHYASKKPKVEEPDSEPEPVPEPRVVVQRDIPRQDYFSAVIEALSLEYRQGNRNDKPNIRYAFEESEKMYTYRHPITKDCIESFERVEYLISSSIGCEMKLKMGKIYSGCYYYIHLYSNDTFYVHDARRVIDKMVYEYLHYDFKETDKVCFAYHIDRRTKKAFRGNWRSLRDLGNDFDVELSFGLKDDEDPERPMLMTGTLRNIGMFRNKVEERKDKKMGASITKQYDFPVQALSEFVGRRGEGLRDLGKATHTAIKVMKDIAKIRITGERLDDIEKVIGIVNKLVARRPIVTAPAHHAFVYRIPIPNYKTEEFLRKHYDDIRSIQKNTGATCLFDGYNTMICSGTYKQAQHAHHGMNILIGVSDASGPYEPIFAVNHSSINRKD